MSKDIQKTALRVPKDLHAKIHEAADESGRSMNAEIVHRLEESFKGNFMSNEDLVVNTQSMLNQMNALQFSLDNTIMLQKRIKELEDKISND